MHIDHCYLYICLLSIRPGPTMLKVNWNRLSSCTTDLPRMCVCMCIYISIPIISGLHCDTLITPLKLLLLLLFVIVCFSRLFVEKLPKHPGYSKASSSDRSRIKKLLKPAFERAMELKEKLRVAYDQEKVTYVQEKKIEEEEKMRVKKEVSYHCSTCTMYI